MLSWGVNLTSKQRDFIMKICRGAIEGWRKYKILPSVTMAQAIVESGWGESGLTAVSNNLFGIKANGWMGKTVDYPTKEFVNGEYISVVDTFRAYDSLDESVADHGAFLAGLERYSNIIGVTDYKTVCHLLQSDGYATSPDYAKTLVSVIEQYGLGAYDSGLLALTVKVSGGDFDAMKSLADSLDLETTWKAWED